MHTKPISTEVIASYEATLTSGFALITEFSFEASDTIPPLEKFWEDMVYILNIPAPACGKIDLLLILEEFPLLMEDVEKYYQEKLSSIRASVSQILNAFNGFGTPRKTMKEAELQSIIAEHQAVVKDVTANCTAYGMCAADITFIGKLEQNYICYVAKKYRALLEKFAKTHSAPVSYIDAADITFIDEAIRKYATDLLMQLLHKLKQDEKAVTHLLFDTVLYLSDEDFRIRSIMEELVNRLTTENKNGAIDKLTMKKFEKLLQLDNDTGEPYFSYEYVRNIFKKKNGKPGRSYPSCLIFSPIDYPITTPDNDYPSVPKSSFVDKLIEFMNAPSLNEETMKILHRHMLPFLLIEDDTCDQDTATRLLCAKKFYETLDQAASQAEEASRLTVADDSSEDQNEVQKAVTDYLSNNTILNGIHQLLSNLDPTNAKELPNNYDVKNDSIYRSLRDYHFALYRFAAISGCSRLVGCVDESIANEQYEHILRFQSFVDAFSDEKEKELLLTMMHCVNESKQLVEEVKKCMELLDDLPITTPQPIAGNSHQPEFIRRLFGTNTVQDSSNGSCLQPPTGRSDDRDPVFV